MSFDAIPTVPSSVHSRWSKREAELLATTLRLLQEHGYDRLTVESVATKARSSKATMYRRWPSKAKLVLAAFREGTRSGDDPPRTGSLRGDLINIGVTALLQSRLHASTVRAVLNELPRNPALDEAFHNEFIHHARLNFAEVIADALARGEIDEMVNLDLHDLLSGYLLFRALVCDRPPTEVTVYALVDDILMPSLTNPRRNRRASG